MTKELKTKVRMKKPLLILKTIIEELEDRRIDVLLHAMVRTVHVPQCHLLRLVTAWEWVCGESPECGLGTQGSHHEMPYSVRQRSKIMITSALPSHIVHDTDSHTHTHGAKNLTRTQSGSQY